MVSKRLRVTALTVGALLLATGCGSGDSGGSKTELKLYNDKGAWKPYFEQMAALGKQETGLDMTPVGYTDEPTYTAFIGYLQCGDPVLELEGGEETRGEAAFWSPGCVGPGFVGGGR